jgi:hypothetical protein
MSSGMAWPFQSKSISTLMFLHVAKCGGTSLVEHFGQLKSRGLCLGFACDSKQQVVAELTRLLDQNASERKDIRAVYGHRVFYGLHEHFDQTCLYATMLRNPVGRVVSLYNHHAGISTNPDHPHHQRDRELLWSQGSLMPFEEWLNQVYTGNHMTRFLYYAMAGNEVDPPGPMTRTHLETAKTFVDRCWFVGTTETSDADYRRMCEVVELRPPKRKVNVSKPFMDPQTARLHQSRISDIDALDLELYEYACKKRQDQLRALDSPPA